MIPKPESVQENETYKILKDFKVQTGHQIPVRRPVLVLSSKKKITSLLVDFSVPTDHWVKNKKKK